MSSSRRWRPLSRLVAPSSPTNSGVQPRAWRRRPRPLAFVATISSSRFLQRSSIGRTSPRSNDISDGREPLLRPSMPWHFLVDIRICSPGATRSAQRRALVAMPNGSSKPSGIKIPTTCFAPPSRSQSVGVVARPRLERRRDHRAAEQRDKLAPFHCAIPPVRSTERIAQLSYGGRLLRCGSQVESDAQAWAIVRKVIE